MTKLIVPEFPACWSWQVSPADRDRAREAQAAGYPLAVWRFLHLWQEGRCGICGRRWSRQPHQGDHDHGTGYVRGYLCRACNTGEAQSLRAGLLRPGYVRYRERHPASILGVRFAWDANHSMTAAAAARLPSLEEYARHQRETDPQRW